MPLHMHAMVALKLGWFSLPDQLSCACINTTSVFVSGAMSRLVDMTVV